ncbi:MAG: hypothetical protein J0G30_00665 [Actinomycetales bacterium]|nr:hypothetical protein [Actinomycetales bacterium]
MSDNRSMSHQVAGHATPRDLRPILLDAIDSVQARGGAQVEAADVLRALAAHPGPAADLLAEAGLDAAAVDAALAEERRHSLASLGLRTELPEPRYRRGGRPRWGASAHAAFDRLRQPGGASPVAVLAGILAAELGTVPRALELAGIDRFALLGRATAAANALRRRG